MSEAFSNVKAHPSTIVLGLGLMMNQAFSAEGFEEGVHYQTLTKPVVTSDPSRVEVLELFWYGCPHCDTLDPALKAWAQQLPSDVLFTRMPVVFGRSWEMHARMFWVAKNLGLLETIHEPLFNAIHREGQRLQRVDDVVAFFQRYGADPAVVKRELAGFATESALRLADARVPCLWDPRRSRTRCQWAVCDRRVKGRRRISVISIAR